MGKTNRNSEKLPIHRNGNHRRNIVQKNSKSRLPTNSSYSILPTSEVTQGAIEVWATLPDEIRQDPSLAPFRQEHERIHGEYIMQHDANFILIRKLSLVYRFFIINFVDNGSRNLIEPLLSCAHFNNFVDSRKLINLVSFEAILRCYKTFHI